MKQYFRLNKTRHIWSADIESPEKWEVSLIQIGRLPSTTEALEMGIAFVAWLQSQELINLPTAEFSTIRQTSGMSGRRDFYSYCPGKIWYDLIPGTDIIRECVGKSKNTHLLHDSCNNSPNSGLTIANENFADLCLIYIQYYSYRRSQEDIDILAMQYATEIVRSPKSLVYDLPVQFGAFRDGLSSMFVPIEDKGIVVKDCGYFQMKFSPDFSFFMCSYDGGETYGCKVMVNGYTEAPGEYVIPGCCMGDQESWDSKAALIEKETGKKIYFRVVRDSILMASLSPLPVCQKVKVGCQAIYWQPENKTFTWKEHTITVDGPGVGFDGNETDLINSHYQTLTDAMATIGVKVEKTDEEGMVVFWFTTIIDSL